MTSALQCYIQLPDLNPIMDFCDSVEWWQQLSDAILVDMDEKGIFPRTSAIHET